MQLTVEFLIFMKFGCKISFTSTLTLTKKRFADTWRKKQASSLSIRISVQDVFNIYLYCLIFVISNAISKIKLIRILIILGESNLPHPGPTLPTTPPP